LNHPNALEATAYRWDLGWGGGFIRTVHAKGHEGIDYRMPVLEVDDDYLKVFQIEKTEGRTFDLGKFPADRSGAFILNESAVKGFQWDDPASGGPIGKSFTWEGPEINGSVVGVVKDFHYGRLTQRIGPMAMTVHTNRFYNLAVRIRPEGVDDTPAHFETLWSQLVDGDVPFDYSFWDRQFEEM